MCGEAAAVLGTFTAQTTQSLVASGEAHRGRALATFPRTSDGFAVGLAVGVLAHEVGGEGVGDERGHAAGAADRRSFVDSIAVSVPSGVAQDLAASALAACSAPWSPIAFMTASVAAPMNFGRLLAAQSRDATGAGVEPWNSGIT